MNGRFDKVREMKITNIRFSYRKQKIKNQQQSMRQDLRERQRQIRKLHQSIQKYQQSPNTKKAVEHATSELINAIQYKYRRSQINRHYVFPKHCQLSDDEFDDFPELVDLKAQTDFLSQDLSVAEEPQSNFVYISEKTMMEDKYSPFSKRKVDKVDNKSRLKIKVVKKKNQQNLQTTEKLDRLKTEHIQTNFSTASYKTELQLHNQLTTSKSRLLPPSSQVARLRQKLKIASRIQKEQPNSPFHPNLTMKTEYTHCTKRKQNKENQRSTMNPHTSSSTHQKYYVGHHQKSSKKTQQNNFKLYLNVRCAVKKNMNMNSHSNLHSIGNGNINGNSSVSINYLREMKKDGENWLQGGLDMSKRKKVCHKSFQSLKSIRLGHNRSTQKLMAKGIHA